MSEHRYPAKSLAADYARAGIGLGLSGLPLLSVPIGSVGMWLLGSLGTLFLTFGLRTAWRHGTILALTPEDISLLRQGRVTLAWTELCQVRLAYYSTRSDRKSGWMQLTLNGERIDDGRRADVTIRVDSTIDDFPAIAARAARAAADNSLELSPATIANLAALGIAAAPDMAAPIDSVVAR